MAVKVPLEMDRPLWKIYLFTNIIKDPLVENDPYVLSPEYETKSVMILRYHHSLADGFSFLKLIFKASNYYDVFHQSPLLVCRLCLPSPWISLLLQMLLPARQLLLPTVPVCSAPSSLTFLALFSCYWRSLMLWVPSRSRSPWRWKPLEFAISEEWI